MVRVLTFIQDQEHDLAWAHPVDGLAAYVDLVEPTGFFDRNPALDVPPPTGC